MAEPDELLKNFVPPEEIENVRVVVRVRPLNKKEIESNHRSIVTVNRINGSISVKNPTAGAQDIPKVFAYDTVFDVDSKQMDVYNETARPIVEKVLAGYNGTIFAYGQTGTGKTFTMEGVNTEPELRGVIPNSFAHLFGRIAKTSEDTNKMLTSNVRAISGMMELSLYDHFFNKSLKKKECNGKKKTKSDRFLVRVSYYEIYNEEVRDLLNSSQSSGGLEVKERPDVGVYIKNLTTYVVNNADDMDRIMNIGNKNRAVGATAMNIESSRSHAIFTITVETSTLGVDNQHHVKMGRLHLVDLAGSERQSKTGATGQRLKEASKINLSLSTLGNVISALVDGKCTHIPYRNSKLTRILQDSLGGNSKTVMCATIGPASYNYDETISTLRYASRAKSICNRARVNENPKDALLRLFQSQIQELKKQLEQKGTDEPVEEESTEDEEQIEDANKILDALLPETDFLDNNTSAEAKEAIRLKEIKDLELEKTKNETNALKEKLENLERKIILGGENLLEKAEEQEQLLEASAKELEDRIKMEAELRSQIEQREAERIDIEEKYSSLQEEAAGLTKKIRKITALLTVAKDELKDICQENQREMESLLDNVRALTKELALQETIEKMFIPASYRELIEKHAHWNEDIGEWELKCVAYTGNNMKKSDVLETTTVKQEGTLDLMAAFHYFLDLKYIRSLLNLSTSAIGVQSEDGLIGINFLPCDENKSSR